MKLKDAIAQWEKEKHLWPDGLNFKNKSNFIGIGNDSETIVLTQSELDSEDWGFIFRSHDDEFNEAINGFLDTNLEGEDEK